MFKEIYWHCFNKVPGLGPKNYEKIINHFDDMKTAYLKASFLDFTKAGLNSKLIYQILSTRSSLDVNKQHCFIKKEGIQIITLKNKHYPMLLKQIYDPPAVLYLKGKIECLNNKYPLAIIGSRKITSYGQKVCFQLVKELSMAGITTISGLAIGCDTLVHQLTLESNGTTIAVLGSGIANDNIYPKNNISLANKIQKNGAVISEFPPDEKAQIPYFPIRNRIISGLAKASIIIEAAEKSGALITARSALDQNRDVFAIPGPIDNPNSQGTNKLIQQGAKLVITGQDILDELCLDLDIQKNIRTENITSQEKTILGLLSTENLHVDKITNKSKIKPSVVNSTLLNLEIKNLIKNIGNQNYIKL